MGRTSVSDRRPGACGVPALRGLRIWRIGRDPGGNRSRGPAFEANWGAAPNLQLHVIVPLGAIVPSNNPLYSPAGVGPSAYGLTDTELGAKYRFVKETKHRPEFGTFTMLEIPTGSYAKGLGVGKVWYKLPVWVQKSWGHWTTYGGGGYQIVPQTIISTSPMADGCCKGTSAKAYSGGEIFSHGQKEGLPLPRQCLPQWLTSADITTSKIPAGNCCSLMAIQCSGKRKTTPILGCMRPGGPRKARRQWIPGPPSVVTLITGSQ